MLLVSIHKNNYFFKNKEESMRVAPFDPSRAINGKQLFRGGQRSDQNYRSLKLNHSSKRSNETILVFHNFIKRCYFIVNNRFLAIISQKNLSDNRNEA